MAALERLGRDVDLGGSGPGRVGPRLPPRGSSILRRDAVDVALALSIWPETYTLVVDECLRAGVPVVAFDMGAPAERLRGGRGILVPAGAGPEGVLQAVSAARGIGDPGAPLPTAERAAEAVLGLYARLGAL
jgi:glycosyltransferase involved in cell wall biosynthesis